MKVTAIILASGKGKRCGLPKAEMQIQGKSFLVHLQEILLEAGMADVFIAQYQDTSDMLSTLIKAVNELKKSQENSGYLVFPVDFPFVKPQTVVALMQEHRQNPNAVIRPIYKNKRGHPILIPACINLDNDDSQQGLKYIIRNCGLPIYDVPVEDDGILKNVNTREDLSLWMPKN